MPQENKTIYAILGVLTLMPGSGYDIKKFCDKGISRFWNENISHIYPMLKRMEKDGLVTKTTEQSEGNPQRNVYTITQKGREKLTDWLAKPVDHAPVRMELLLKLYFAQNIPSGSMLRQLEDIKRKHEEGLQACLKIEEDFLRNERAKDYNGYPYWLATLRYGIGDAQFRIKWCEDTIESIKAHQATEKG